MCGLAAILVLLAVVLWLLSRPVSTQQPSDVSDAGDTLTERSITQQKVVSSLHVKNEAGGFVLSKGEEGQYFIDGISSDMIDSALAANYIQTTEQARLPLVTKAPEDAKQFGLDLPSAIVEIDFDSAVCRLEIGGRVPGENARYVRFQGEAAVYRWYGADGFLCRAQDFISKRITPPAPKETSVISVLFSGTIREEELVLECEMLENSIWKIVSRENETTDRQNVQDAVSALFSLEADEIAAYNPTPSELAAYGLSQPYSAVEVSYTDGAGQAHRWELSASAPLDGTVYLLRDNIPIVYKIKVDALPWLELQYKDVAAELPMLFNIETVESIAIDGPEIHAVFHLSKQAGDLRITDQTGQEINTELFRQFYQCLIGVPREEFTEVPARQEAGEIVRIIFCFADGKEPVEVRFLEGPALQAYLSVNGNAEFLTKAKYAQTILENVIRLETEKEILKLY